MFRVFKYVFILLVLVLNKPVSAQYLCDEESKFFRKQKNTLKHNTKLFAKNWLAVKSDSLKIPKDIKLTKLKFTPEEDTLWTDIDSLLCVRGGNDLLVKAEKVMIDKEMVIYQIQSTFDLIDSTNPEIKTILFFQFNYKGVFLRAILRQKEMSPFSETPYH